MSNEELRNNDDIVEGATEGTEEDEATRRKRRRKARRKKRIKETIMVYAMLFLMVIGAISILYVPYLHHQNEVLKTNLEYYEGTETNEGTSQLIEEFLSYVEGLDVSDGISWDELMDFEETILEYELVVTMSQLSDSVYTEQLIISKLQEAYQNTSDQEMKEVIQAVIESHELLLTEKESDFAEYEEFISQYLEMKKHLEEEFKKLEDQPIDTV